ncbi:hypothetical protein SAMN04487946_103125 [Halobellus clavatus]|jgi:hypothetical protein|uniref:Uncharacterized protein n=1 Tax=Halobellus clavatus TaxID=660517 RepID=A0A1H3F3W0_9EURY|nr:hypothetical protein SAMN04487946_103125 [Halobellus clavatus]
MGCATRSTRGCGRPLTEPEDRSLGRTAARWLSVGAVAGVVVAGALLPLFGARAATDTSFALGALVFGFGIATWAGTVGFGSSVAAVQERLGGHSGWTQEGARQAFAVLTWIGVGWSATAVAASLALVGP